MNDRQHQNESSEESLAQQAERESAGLLREFWLFLCENKKWWLIPFLLSLVVLGLLVVLSSSPLAPFVYPF